MYMYESFINGAVITEQSQKIMIEILIPDFEVFYIQIKWVVGEGFAYINMYEVVCSSISPVSKYHSTFKLYS